MRLGLDQCAPIFPMKMPSFLLCNQIQSLLKMLHTEVSEGTSKNCFPGLNLFLCLLLQAPEPIHSSSRVAKQLLPKLGSCRTSSVDLYHISATISNRLMTQWEKLSEGHPSLVRTCGRSEVELEEQKVPAGRISTPAPKTCCNLRDEWQEKKEK